MEESERHGKGKMSFEEPEKYTIPNALLKTHSGKTLSIRAEI
jgi:hypothetical protein